MKSELPILGIETSQEVCGAAVLSEPDKFSESIVHIKNIHSEKIFSVIDQALKLADKKLNMIKAIAVSAGPGSFTGLRIGMSAAKGIAVGSSLPIIPVPTFEALALQICSFVEDKTEFLIANKVNSDEVYYARYYNNSGIPGIIDELKVINKETLKAPKKNLVFGNAMKLSTDDVYNVNAPNPYWISKWAYLFGKDLLTYSYDFLEPSYHKNFIAKVKL